MSPPTPLPLPLPYALCPYALTLMPLALCPYALALIKGKDRIGKDRLGKDRIGKEGHGARIIKERVNGWKAVWLVGLISRKGSNVLKKLIFINDFYFQWYFCFLKEES
uniref:Uncharacterized protein n=1 Tax=Pleurotus citrinopileatus TaxID=98342 RepID=A0A2K9YPF8_PLECI|nr:hypothetical protein [Pleurotus citrinopileatus]AUW35264.1 hypothetical protein [Pleurotus citrinopileatus]